jgi:peptidoglycan/xylan/chitin deacetylase (PgdA/CDA1 family)
MPELKHVALRAAFHAGFFRLVQLARRRQTVILTFHRFSSNGTGDSRGVSIAAFAECLEFLTRHYRVVSLDEITGAFQRGEARPNTAVITIDDGYHEVFSLAAPVLRRYGVPASVFVVSDFIDGRMWLWPDRFRFVFERAPVGQVVIRHGGSSRLLDIRTESDRRQAEEFWLEYAKGIPVAERDELLDEVAEACRVELPTSPPDQYRSMTWAQLRALAAEGFEIGAHTRTHHIFSRLDRNRLRDEIAGCKEHIEQNLGVAVQHFAYPNGRERDYTPESVAEVARAGYRAAVTMIAGGNTPDTPIHELRRIGGDAEDVFHFAQAVSGVDLLKDRLRVTRSGSRSDGGWVGDGIGSRPGWSSAMINHASTPETRQARE